MAWLSDNLAVASGVLVPLLLGVVKPLIEKESGGRTARKLRRHAQLRALLGDDTLAASNMDRLLAEETKMFVDRGVDRLNRKVDGGTVVTIIFVSLVGGAISFGLVSWAQSTEGFGAGLLWVVFGAWTTFILLLVFAGGFSSLYKKDETGDGN